VIAMVSTSKSYSVLITDDDRGCREALREIMEPEGFHTRLASSGEEALDIVREEPIHLALLDMNMPTLSGLETLELVRQVNAVLPVILVTADRSEALMRQALLAHAYSVIAKPVSKHIVLYTVVRALSRAYGEP
jgi:DNA-binding NtrC family response regulator